MSTVAEQWLAVYRERLMEVKATYPTFPRSHMIDLAKGSAHIRVPEGQECLMMRASVSIRKPGPGEAAPKVDAYTLEVGKAIVLGMARINGEVLGPKPKRGVGKAQAPVPPQAPVQEAMPEPEAEPTATRTVHRLPKAEKAHWLRVYQTWADGHDTVPGDTVLSHFTGVPVSSWATLRGDLTEQGYKFEAVGSKNTRVIKVLARPAKAPELTAPVSGGLEARMGEIERLLGVLLNGGRNA